MYLGVKVKERNMDSTDLFNSGLRLTIVGVSDTVLKDGVPLLLLLLGHHTEIVVTSIRVPEDEGKLCRTFQEWRTANFSFYTWKTHVA